MLDSELEAAGASSLLVAWRAAVVAAAGVCTLVRAEAEAEAKEEEAEEEEAEAVAGRPLWLVGSVEWAVVRVRGETRVAHRPPR